MSLFLRSNLRPTPTVAGTYSAITGAAPQTINGAALAIMNPDGRSALAVMPGTLSAKVVLRVTTNLLTVSAKWQVSSDSTTWIDCAGSPNNPANVVLATGNGVLATTTLMVPASDAVYGHQYARLVLTSGAAAGGGAGVDEASIGYDCRVSSAVL